MIKSTRSSSILTKRSAVLLLFHASKLLGDVLNFLLKGLKFTFPTSLESSLMIREEVVVGHISSCRSCSGEGGENGIHYVRDKEELSWL